MFKPCFIHYIQMTHIRHYDTINKFCLLKLFLYICIHEQTADHYQLIFSLIF